MFISEDKTRNDVDWSPGDDITNLSPLNKGEKLTKHLEIHKYLWNDKDLEKNFYWSFKEILRVFYNFLGIHLVFKYYPDTEPES